MIRRILLLLLLHIVLIYGNQLLDPDSIPIICPIHGLVLIFVVTGGAEERDEVVDTQAHVLELVTGQSRRCQGALLLLKLEKIISKAIRPHSVKKYLEDALLDGVGHGKLIDVDSASLAESMRAVKRLVLKRGVPPEVDEDNVGAARQVQTYSSTPVSESIEIRSMQETDRCCRP